MENRPVSTDYERIQFEINIPAYIILTLITCGIFNLYWNYRQMETCNYFLKRPEFIFMNWLFLSIITCGIYHVYYQYKMGSAIVEIQHQRQLIPNPNLPILSVILTVCALSFVTDLIHQQELNNLLR